MRAVAAGAAAACALAAIAPAAAQTGLRPVAPAAPREPGLQGPAGGGLRQPAAPGTTAPGGAAPGRAGAGSPGAAAPAAPASRTPIELDRIVAVVNNEVITARELAQRAGLVEAQLRQRNVQLPARDVFERQVLERMIVDRAQLQLARESGVRVDDQAVDRTIARIAEQSGLTVTQFRDRIEQDGVPFSRFREEIREEVIETRLREREVDAKVQVSDAEVDAFLAEQTGGGAPTEYLVSQILLRVPENASPEQIEQQRARADEVLRRLAAGEDFERLAAAYSDAPGALTEGGSLGWRSAERLPALFLDAVAKLSPGTVAPVARSANGFHVLKLVDRRRPQGSPALGGPVTQTHARHILVRVNELTSEAEAQRRLADIRERIVAGSTSFEDMARQYSADGSAGRGGDLGWVYPGDTVPEFERAMQALQPGQVSEPVRTPFGYHLIEVIERRTDDASPERTRQQARQALRERKVDEAYQEWLRQLRDRTYVELRAD